MTDLQKNSFIEPGESCPHLLKIAMENYENDEKIIKIMILKELGCLVQKYGIASFFLQFPICCQTLFRILFQI